jgi:menaquinone reductase, molybdopterin-binding-like subunit
MTISRREFLVGTVGAGVGFGLGAVSHMLPLAPPEFKPAWQPGVESFAASTCLLCPAHCGIRARLIDGACTRIDGNPLHPVSLGGLCPKGQAGIQLTFHPGRLKGPVRRVGAPGSEDFESITWDDAIGQIVAALRSARESGAAGSIEWLVGRAPGVMGELISAFCRAYGTDRITVDDYRDGSASVMRLAQGIDAPPAFDLPSSDLVLSFGAGLSEAWWASPLAAQARNPERGRGPRWIQVDVRLSRTAVGADEWIPIRPGTYGTLALGVAYLLAKEGLFDVDFVSERVAGWEDWTDEGGEHHVGFRSLVLRNGRPEDVSNRTGVPIARLTQLAKAFGTARSPVAIWDHAVSWRKTGLSDALAIHALNVLRGALNRPGGVLVQAPLALPGPLDKVPPGSADLSRRPLTSMSWPANGAEGTRATQVLFMYQSNPVASASRIDAARQALARVPLVVSFSPFFDESAKYANLILPDCTYLERWQDAPAPAAVAFPVWGVVQPVIKPLYDTRATGDVILDVAAHLGGEVNAWSRWKSVEEIVKERGMALAGARRGSAFVDRFRQHELRALEERGWWMPHDQSADDYWKTIVTSGGWFDPRDDHNDRTTLSQHPDGRVWIFPAAARRQLLATREPLAEGFLPIVPAGATGAAASDAPAVGARESFPLRLVPFRVMTLASGGTTLMPWLLEHLGVLTGHAWETWAEINPSTARGLGLRMGQRVRVESLHGAFDATLRLFDGAQPGVVNVPYGLQSHVTGWGVSRGANPLVVIGDAADAASGLPDWYSTSVRLIPV